jgi:serine O-acetyltransferase
VTIATTHVNGTSPDPSGPPAGDSAGLARDTSLFAGDRDNNPSGIGLLALLAEDFRTHDRDALSAGFWAVALHRLGNRRMAVRRPWLRAPLSLLYGAAYRGVIALWGIDLPYNVKVGRRLRIAHHGCVHIGAREIGDDVVIRHAVTIGLIRQSASAFPTIGSRVEIGPGACIVGAVHVGDDSLIGANTVVTESLPPGSDVLGVPASRFAAAAIRARQAKQTMKT